MHSGIFAAASLERIVKCFGKQPALEDVTLSVEPGKVTALLGPNGAGKQQLADAVRKVHAGGRVVDPQLAVEAWTESDPLNERERQVLRLAGEGASSADIAAQLNLSHGTVRNYLSEAIGKLNAGNRIEAYRLARQKGWL